MTDEGEFSRTFDVVPVFVKLLIVSTVLFPSLEVVGLVVVPGVKGESLILPIQPEPVLHHSLKVDMSNMSDIMRQTKASFVISVTNMRH